MRILGLGQADSAGPAGHVGIQPAAAQAGGRAALWHGAVRRPPPARARRPRCTPRSATSTCPSARSGRPKTRSKSRSPGCARSRSTRRSTGPSPRPCAPSCAPTRTPSWSAKIRDGETAQMAVEASLTGPPGAQHPAYQQRTRDGDPPARHGHGPVQLRRFAARRAGATPGATHLRPLPHRTRRHRRGDRGTARRLPQRLPPRASPRDAPAARRRAGGLDGPPRPQRPAAALPQPGLRQVRQHRLQGAAPAFTS